MKKFNSNKAPTSREDVILLKQHTHQGELYQAGDMINVNTVEKDWLIQNEIIAATIAKRGE